MSSSFLARRSGVLLHPTSLPGPHGCGDLGESAYHFVDWLVAAGQTLWQVLPLGGVGPGNSPYVSPSAFAGNELLIDVRQLHQAGLLFDADLAQMPVFSARRVDYGAVRLFKSRLLRLAAKRFFAGKTSDPSHEAYADFCASQGAWLNDYALFMALDAQYAGEGKLWQDWPAPLAKRLAAAVRQATQQHAEEIGFWKFAQWCFHRQWQAVKAYANARQIEIVGDLPIFVAGHSADVWSHPELFDLDGSGQQNTVAGVPPDYFSATGQRWGNPLYRWSAHAATGYRWWVDRMRQTMSLCDIVRIDHFRGFEAFWEIPASAATAIDGKWQPGPGKAVFDAMARELGDAQGALRIIAEDLGIITPEVNALRESVGLPGMRILQFAFDGDAGNSYLPHNFEANTVVYTGTHDNDTTRGWWQTLTADQHTRIAGYLGIGKKGRADMPWPLIRAAYASVAAWCVIPLQDVLGLDSSHRMNQPGLSADSWEWRFDWSQVNSSHAERLLEFSRVYGRQRR